MINYINYIICVFIENNQIRCLFNVHAHAH